MQAKHGAAAPGYPLFPSSHRASSPHTIAATRSLAPPPLSSFFLRATPSSSPVTPFSFFSPLLHPSCSFRRGSVSFLRRPSSLRSKSPPLDARMLDATIHHVHVVAGLTFFPRFPSLASLSLAAAAAPAAFRWPGPPSRSLDQYRFLFVSSLPSFFRGGPESRCIRAAFIPSPLETRETRAQAPSENPSAASRFLARCRSLVEAVSASDYPRDYSSRRKHGRTETSEH